MIRTVSEKVILQAQPLVFYEAKAKFSWNAHSTEDSVIFCSLSSIYESSITGSVWELLWDCMNAFLVDRDDFILMESINVDKNVFL